MDFTHIARYWREDVAAQEASASAAERATTGGEKQINNTTRARDKQKAQMATQKVTPVKSDVSYTSEEARRKREYDKMLFNNLTDWRAELYEAAAPEEGTHPYVDVMPFVNQKAMEAKRQMKDAAKLEAGKQQTNAMQEETDAEFEKRLKGEIDQEVIKLLD